MTKQPASAPAEITRYATTREPEQLTDLVSVEQPLELRVRGRSIAITMRTPGHDTELAAGFALSEGIVTDPQQIVEIAHCTRSEATHPENIVNLFLTSETACDLERLSRHVFASSSCGICGKASIEAIHENWPPVDSDFQTTSATLRDLPAQLNAAQSEFKQTGGLHAAALARPDGTLVCLREDVGRHNAVDKVIGWGILNGILPSDDHLLVVSSRASFEIMQKALAAHIPLVAAISAPSSLAIEFAHANRQTLVGFLRPTGFNIYSHPQRIQD